MAINIFLITTINFSVLHLGIAVQASVCTSFVARVTNTTDTVEVRLNSIRMADVLINGQIQDFSEVSWLRYNGIYHELNMFFRDILLFLHYIRFTSVSVSILKYAFCTIHPVVHQGSKYGLIY